MFYKFLTITIISLSSCNNNSEDLEDLVNLEYVEYLEYLKSSKHLEYSEYLEYLKDLSTKETLSLEEKEHLYPSWNISIRNLQNKSAKKGFTDEEKEITLRIMSIIRFVLNTPEYEANILSQTMKASTNARGITTDEIVYVGDILDSERVLKTVQKAVIETEIALADLGVNILGQATVPSVYLYLENMNHPNYPSIIRKLNDKIWLEFTSDYTFDNDLDAYAIIGNTILHESVHHMGFTHLKENFTFKTDVAYVIGDTYAKTLINRDFLEKYKHEFKKIIPYYEEKYRKFIKDDPAVRTTRNAENPIFTHSTTGAPLTVIECVIENPDDYSKAFRYVVKDGKRTIDNFISK